MAKIIRCLLLLISGFLITAVVVTAATHQITWDAGFDCATWASKQTFTVGDELIFFSANLKNVLNVSHIDYIYCNPASPYATYQTGNNPVTIGQRDVYFISSNREDCRGGLKLHVHVTAAAASSSFSSNHGLFFSVIYTGLIVYLYY